MTTTASLHDSQVDLSRKDETVCRDEGYFSVQPHASRDKTVHHGVRGHLLSIREKRRDRAIMRVRALVERPFTVIKREYMMEIKRSLPPVHEFMSKCSSAVSRLISSSFGGYTSSSER